MPLKPATAYLLLTLTVLFWSGNVIIARMLHADISAIALSSGRWWLATLLVLPFTWHHLRRDWPVLRAHWPIITLLSLLGISLFNTLLYQSAHSTSSNNIALIQSTMPAMIILLAAMLYGERPGARAMTGVALSIAGAVLVIARGNWQVLSELAISAGDLWMLLANAVYALYSVLLRKSPQMHPMSFVGASFIIGSLLLLPLFLWDLSINPLPALNDKLAIGLVYIAIFPSILAYLFWNRGVVTVGASTAGFFICLIPVFTALLAALFLDEGLAWYHLAGMLLIVAGFVLFQQRPASQ